MKISFEDRKDDFLRGLAELTKQTKIKVDGTIKLEMCDEWSSDNPNAEYECESNGENVTWNPYYGLR